jgi:hypothetical protein
MKHFVVALTLLIALTTFAQSPEYTGKCEITFHVVNYYGKPLDYTVKHVVPRRRTSPELASHFVRLHGTNLDPGDYEYELVPSGPHLDTLRGMLFLQRPNTWVTRTVWDEAGDFAYSEIPGAIRPYRASKEPTWVRAVSVYDGNGPESKVLDDGTFMLPVVYGKFILLVCRGNEVLYNQIYEFPLNRQKIPLNIRLQSN